MFLIPLDIQTGDFKILLYTSIIQYPAEFFRSADKILKLHARNGKHFHKEIQIVVAYQIICFYLRGG